MSQSLRRTRADVALRVRRWRERAGVVRTDVRQRLLAAPGVGRVLRAGERLWRMTTPLGRALVAAALGGMSVGAATAWAEAWAVGLGAAVMVVAGLPFIVGRSRYVIGMHLSSTRVTVGDAGVGELTVAPAGRRSAAAVVELPVGAATAEFRVPALAEGQSHSELLTVPTRRRGVIALGPATTVRGDALGVFRRRQQWNEAVELFVHPRTVALGSQVLGFLRDVEGAVTQDLSSSDVSFHALREYAPGDDRRHVHWRSTARTGRLLVRQFEETRRAHLLVVLDLSAQAWPDEEDFETAVACAASLVVAMRRDGREVSVVTSHGSLMAPSAQRALDEFCRVEISHVCADVVATARHGADVVPQASVCVVLTGPGTSEEEIHRACSLLPLSATHLVLRAHGAGPVGMRNLGGAQVMSVPSVDLLPLVLRRLG